MARYVVTGGAGFIGSHLARTLLAAGHGVVVLDNLSTGYPENIPDGAEFIEGDISDPQAVSRLPVGNVDGVVHLAAQSSGEISFENPHADMRVNVGGTVLLLDWCRRNSVQRFVYISSMGAYGVSSDEPLTEDTPCRPESFYGVGKLASENYVRVYASLGLKATTLRPFNVYGPGQNIRNMKQGMASIYMAYLLRDEPIVVKGRLGRFRDQTHVADVADFAALCLEREEAVGQTYNVATGRKTTVRELLDAMLKIAGKDPSSYPVEQAPGTAGDLFGCFADITKARTELGWEPKMKLESGLRDMYEFFSQ